jgi:hypothetical protein
VLGLTLLCPLILRAGQFYVAPTGSPSNDGSIAKPWDLQTALDQPPSVRPGDTIWLRGGTYSGTFTSFLAGTANRPIIVRNYERERATIDSNNSSENAALTIGGSFAWFWGLEIMSSDPTRVTSTSGSNPPDIVRGDGVAIDQSTNHPGLKAINLVIHDTRQGISNWKQGIDFEANGCIVYYNGWVGPDRGHGHGMYVQNDTGSTKNTTDCLFFDQFGEGAQAYSTTGPLKYIHFTGSVFFDNGIASSGWERNLLMGGVSGGVVNPVVDNCFLYYPASSSPDTAFEIGYSGIAASGVTITNNYIANNSDILGTGMTITGNTFYGNVANITPSQYPNNTYLTSRPSGVKVFLRRNQYEPGRANIIVYNWAGNSTASVDLSSVLTVGSAFEIRNAQNYFGTPVLSGTYAGGTVSLPLTGLPVAAPVGYSKPPATGPEFNAFVLVTTHFAEPTPRALPFKNNGKPVVVKRP